MAVTKTSEIETEDPRIEDLMSQLSLRMENDCLCSYLSILRFKTKDDDEARRQVMSSGGLSVLSPLISSGSGDPKVSELSTTVLHNVSMLEEFRAPLLEDGIATCLVHALTAGTPTEKANAAATIFNLGQSLPLADQLASSHPEFFPLLLSLLETTNVEAQKDAAKSLYYLTLCKDGREEAIKVGIHTTILSILDGGVPSSFEDKCIAVLANLAKSRECHEAFRDEGLGVLGEIMECRRSRAIEDAVCCLWEFVRASETLALDLISQEGLIPSLVALSKSSKVSQRARRKAKEVVLKFRRQRQGSDALRFSGGSSAPESM